jgi:hypothetical protein
VWTWNAIGRRRGAVMLAANAEESERGFLLNHAISELLPPDAQGRRYLNSDPITGQAAWFDLRVRLRKCLPAEEGVSAPQFAVLPPLDGLPPAPHIVAYGAQFHAKETRP